MLPRFTWLSFVSNIQFLSDTLLAGTFSKGSGFARVSDTRLGKVLVFAAIGIDGFLGLFLSNKGGASKLFLN